MSLNRSEQLLLDYWGVQIDESRHWHAKVDAVTRVQPAPGEAARVLERELWAYFVERSTHVEPFKSLAARQGLERTSMINLAEYLVRLWGPPPKPKPQPHS